MFGNIGPTEIILVVLVIVLLFGGKKIPEIAKGLAQGIKEFKKGAKETENEPPKVTQAPEKKEGEAK